VNERMGGYMNGWVNRFAVECADVWSDGWMIRCMVR